MVCLVGNMLTNLMGNITTLEWSCTILKVSPRYPGNLISDITTLPNTTILQVANTALELATYDMKPEPRNTVLLVVSGRQAGCDSGL